MLELRWSEGLIGTGYNFNSGETRNRAIAGLVGWRFDSR